MPGDRGLGLVAELGRLDARPQTELVFEDARQGLVLTERADRVPVRSPYRRPPSEALDRTKDLMA